MGSRLAVLRNSVFSGMVSVSTPSTSISVARPGATTRSPAMGEVPSNSDSWGKTKKRYETIAQSRRALVIVPVNSDESKDVEAGRIGPFSEKEKSRMAPWKVLEAKELEAKGV